MSYSRLLDSELRRAFRLAKDLAVEATFNIKLSGGFNFAAKQAEDFGQAPVKTLIVVFDGVKQKGETKVVRKQFLVQARDVVDLKGYDTVAFEGHTWTVGPILKGTGFIYVAEAFRPGG